MKAPATVVEVKSEADIPASATEGKDRREVFDFELHGFHHQFIIHTVGKQMEHAAEEFRTMSRHEQRRTRKSVIRQLTRVARRERDGMVLTNKDWQNYIDNLAATDPQLAPVAHSVYRDL
jgi:hypothetical protein